jgi:hypothetical protein
MVRSLFVFVLASTVSWSCLAAECEDYPNTVGINPEMVEGGVKIVSTGSAVVSFDDASSIADARDEATLLAKAGIAKFLTEGIRSDEAINRAVQETKSMQGESKAVARKEVVERLRQLSSSSQALLRGVVPLGECYTKGREFRVSVGIKPETIRTAESLSGSMSQSVTRQPAPQGGGPTPSRSVPESTVPSQKLDGTDSFSRADGLKKF